MQELADSDPSPRNRSSIRTEYEKSIECLAKDLEDLLALYTRRVLAASMHDESGGTGVCDRARINGQDERMPEAGDSPRGGAPAGVIGPPETAPTRRSEAADAGA